MTTKGFLPRGDDIFGLTFGNLLFNVFSIRWNVTSNSDFTRYNVFYCIKRHVKNNAFAVCDVKSNNDIPLNREISDKHSIAKPGKYQINHLYLFIHCERNKRDKSISKPILERKIITLIDFFKQYLVLSFWLCTGDRPPLISVIFRLFWWILVIFAHSFESGYQQKLNIEKKNIDETY